MPALVLNYFGQGALMLARPGGALDNPFFALVQPGRWTYALVVLVDGRDDHRVAGADLRRVLADAPGVQLGYFPRVRVMHTSREAEGQIYVPSQLAAGSRAWRWSSGSRTRAGSPPRTASP